jgi:hypothetical protein
LPKYHDISATRFFIAFFRGENMQKIRFGLITMWLLLCLVISAEAQVSIGIGLPNLSIGINLPLFPELVRVPGYPVYYAPRVEANYFFYDGMYWVYQDDNWYASSWYNGPWGVVGPDVVPLFILRIPVRYYRQPPVYFRGWQPNAPPRWSQHWGREWEQRRSGWDRWDRRSAPRPAPLPVYQRQYSGDRYPRVEQQQKLRNQQYRYQPRERTVREHFKQPQIDHKSPAPDQRRRQEAPPERSQRQQDTQHSMPPHQGGAADSRLQPPNQPSYQQRGPASQDQRQQPTVAPREQQSPRMHDQEQRSQERGVRQEPDRGHGQGQDKDEERGRGRNN